MGNVIKRSTVFIELEALTNSSAYGEGELTSTFKNDGRWLTKRNDGRYWRHISTNLRNENYYRFINQYSMPELIYKLQANNEDYYTVCYEMLEEAINTAFTECKNLITFNDLYNYIADNLI